LNVHTCRVGRCFFSCADDLSSFYNEELQRSSLVELVLELTGSQPSRVHLLLGHHANNRDRRTDIDQQRHQRVDHRLTRMEFQPLRSVAVGKFQDTNAACTPTDVAQGFHKEHFVHLAQQDSAEGEDGEPTSDMGLTQPTAIDNQRHVHAFDGHECREPIDHSIGCEQKVAECLAEESIARGIGMKPDDIGGQMDQTSDEKSEVELVDDTHAEQVLGDAVANEELSAKGQNGEEIVGERDEEDEKRDENEKSNRRRSMNRAEIRQKQLVECEAE
jgi:hypothetical protein